MADGSIKLDGLSIAEKRQLLSTLLERRATTDHPLSPGQRALWLVRCLDPTTSAYNVAGRWQIRSALDVETLRAALQRAADRHAMLRTTFHPASGDAIQRLHARWPVAFEATDGREWSSSQLETALDAAADRPFDLEREPGFRARLFTTGDHAHTLQLTFHHIVYDLESGVQLTQELPELYRAACNGRAADLAEPGDYLRFAERQRELLESETGKWHWTYWREQLSGELPRSELPTDHPRPAFQTFGGRSHPFEIPSQVSAALRALARSSGTTPYVVLLTAFAAWLRRHGSSDQVLIGSPGVGRSQAEFERVVGYCVNPLVLRLTVSLSASFAATTQAIRDTVLDAIEHGEFPFPALVERLDIARDPSRSPLFQVAFTWNRLDRLNRQPSSPDPQASDREALELRYLGGGQRGANFDLDLAISEVGETLSGWWRYNTALFSPESIAGFAEQFLQLLGGIVEQPACSVGSLPLLSAASRAEAIASSGQRDRGLLESRFPARSLVSALKAQVENAPRAVAASCEGEQLTYAELEQRANRVAQRLLREGVGPESQVAFLLDRSLAVPVVVLGILKTGAAYVPLDESWPAERIRFVADDAKVKAIVTRRELLARVAGLGAGDPPLDAADPIPIICLEEVLTDPPAAAPDVPLDASSLAYVIYTSGSSGTPKGVGVTHGNVLSLFAATRQAFAFGPREVWTLFHSIAFDFSVWELWGALLHGGRVVVVPYEVSRSPARFHRLLADEGVSVLSQTPTAFRQLIDADAQMAALSSLRYVVFGGEALAPQMLDPWVARYGDQQPALVNMYGITETTVHVTFRRVKASDVQAGASLIGEAIPGWRAHVLDAALEPVPDGMRGEICVGGAGVSRGYLGRPALTAARFVPDPFSIEPGARVYRSGDIGRRLASGDLLYEGRLDQQVKIRGFRIELGEIESAVRRHPGVADAVAVTRDDGDGAPQLVAYVVPDPVLAGPARNLIALERRGRLEGHLWTELPNGLPIVHRNRHETDFLFREIFEDEQYFRHGIALPSRACVFDVGANVGLFAVAVALRHPDATVFAFEPIAPVYDVLERNAELYAPVLRPRAAGLSDHEGQASFTFYPQLSILSSRFGNRAEQRSLVETFARHQAGAGEEDARGLDELLDERLSSTMVECALTTVSAAMRREGVSRIDLLKIDVEKSELDVLRGVDEDDWPRIAQVLVEVHDEAGRLETVTGLLRARGFEVASDQDSSLAGTELYTVYARRAAAVTPAALMVPDTRFASPDRLTSSLRDELARVLPPHMLPASMVLLDALPLTANGKVDRRALPAPIVASRETRAPRTPLEEDIARVWREVLKVETLGIDDNFFEIGGHSILAARAVARVSTAISVEVSLRTLFEAPTVEQLALAIVEQQASAMDPDAFARALAEVEGA